MSRHVWRQQPRRILLPHSSPQRDGAHRCRYPGWRRKPSWTLRTERWVSFGGRRTRSCRRRVSKRAPLDVHAKAAGAVSLGDPPCCAAPACDRRIAATLCLFGLCLGRAAESPTTSTTCHGINLRCCCNLAGLCLCSLLFRASPRKGIQGPRKVTPLGAPGRLLPLDV